MKNCEPEQLKREQQQIKKRRRNNENTHRERLKERVSRHELLCDRIVEDVTSIKRIQL